MGDNSREVEMAKSGDVLEMGPLGLRVELMRTGEETGGELLEFDVVGRARGFLAQGHVHPTQTERLEMVSGSMKVVMEGRERIISAGESIEVPAGTPHSQIPAGEGEGRVRIQVRPAGDTQGFLERMSEMCRDGQVTKSGYPRPLAGARLLVDFSHTGYATKPPLGVQRALARTVLAI